MGQTPRSTERISSFLRFLYSTCSKTEYTRNRFMALWILSGTTRVSRYQKKHSPTHTHRGRQSSLSAFSSYYDPWHPPYSIHMLYSLFPQSLSSFLWSTSWPGTLQNRTCGIIGLRDQCTYIVYMCLDAFLTC